MGQVFAGQIPYTAGRELSEYLQDYISLEQQALSPRLVITVLLLYARYPLLAILLGFTTLGVLLLPCLTVFFGFFLSFSVSCFSAVFGADGIVIAMAISGVRCLVTLPCYLILAVQSWKTSTALAVMSFGRGRRFMPVVYGKDWWLRLVVCAVFLLVGVCLDLFCAPWLLRLALDRVVI